MRLIDGRLSVTLRLRHAHAMPVIGRLIIVPLPDNHDYGKVLARLEELNNNIIRLLRDINTIGISRDDSVLD